MQTFLPLNTPDLTKQVEILDNRRLNKQRFEAQQIYNAITNGGHYRNHPATKMWEQNQNMLLAYGWRVSIECDRRLLADNVGTTRWFLDELERRGACQVIHDGIELTYQTPWWFGHPEFHHHHALVLLHKDWNWYNGRLSSTFAPLPEEPITHKPDYMWPIHRGEIANIETRDREHWLWPTTGVKANVLLGTRYTHPKVFSGRLRVAKSPHMVLETTYTSGKSVRLLLENGKDLL